MNINPNRLIAIACVMFISACHGTQDDSKAANSTNAVTDQGDFKTQFVKFVHQYASDKEALNAAIGKCQKIRAAADGAALNGKKDFTEPGEVPECAAIMATTRGGVSNPDFVKWVDASEPYPGKDQNFFDSNRDKNYMISQATKDERNWCVVVYYKNQQHEGGLSGPNYGVISSSCANAFAVPLIRL